MRYSLILFVCLLPGCGSLLPANQTIAPMLLCNQAKNSDINPEILNAALVKANIWSNKFYGNDCVVCAEVYAIEAHRFSIHITSPAELLINTSATIEFGRSRARTLNTWVHHSCRVRRVDKSTL